MVKLLFTRRGWACWPRSPSLLLCPLLRWLLSVAAWRMYTARVARLAVGLQPGASTRISPGAPGSFEHGSMPVATQACVLERVFVRRQATAYLLACAYALSFWRLPVRACRLCSVVNLRSMEGHWGALLVKQWPGAKIQISAGPSTVNAREPRMKRPLIVTAVSQLAYARLTRRER